MEKLETHKRSHAQDVEFQPLCIPHIQERWTFDVDRESDPLGVNQAENELA